MCGTCGFPNQTTERNGLSAAACLRMNFNASSVVTSEPSPWNFSGTPLRPRTGSRSKKLSAETHSSKPNLPGFSGSAARMARPGIVVVFLSPFLPLRCHLPKCPVAYPADCRTFATVSSWMRIGDPGANVPMRLGLTGRS